MRMTRTLALSAVALTAFTVAAVAAPKIGEPAPDFKLMNSEGKPVQLSELKGKVVVLEWFNDECPFVVYPYEKKIPQNLAKKYAEKDVVWLAINSTAHHNVEHNAEIRKKWGIEFEVLDDSSGEVGKQYRARHTPTMYIIDKEGNLAYMGALDNAPRGQVRGDEYVNYTDKALEELTSGKKVSMQKTKPYGCSVKYAKKPKKEAKEEAGEDGMSVE